MRRQILFIFTITALLAQNISLLEFSYYFDRIPLREAKDFLIFHIQSKDLRVKSKKVYYKIPQSLNHKESFQVYLCDKGSLTDYRQTKDRK